MANSSPAISQSSFLRPSQQNKAVSPYASCKCSKFWLPVVFATVYLPTHTCSFHGKKYDFSVQRAVQGFEPWFNVSQEQTRIALGQYKKIKEQSSALISLLLTM